MKPKKIIKYKNLSEVLKDLFSTKFGTDYRNSVTEFKDPRDNKLHKAVVLETEEAEYLVVVDKELSKINRQVQDINNETEDFIKNLDEGEMGDLSLYFAM